MAEECKPVSKEYIKQAEQRIEELTASMTEMAGVISSGQFQIERLQRAWQEMADEVHELDDDLRASYLEEEGSDD